MAARHSSPPHRGRIQAQGGGTERSVSWAQDKPPTTEDGLRLVTDLIAKLTAAEFNERAPAFEKAREFITRAGEHGGVDAVISKSWAVRGAIRVDLEVKVGKAFVPNQEQIVSA